MKRVSKYHLDIVLSIFLILILILHFVPGIPISVTVTIAVALVGLVPVLVGAFNSFREREWASMDLLASIALVFSLLSGEWVSAIFIELMLAAARILEDITRDRTERSIRGLLKLRPELAEVEQGGVLIKTKLKDIKVGDVVVVSLGERIPVDGIVLSGTGSVNESTLTGESLPIDKKEGSKVMSSTLLESGSLRVRTTHTGKDTTLERVIRLVESAREEKPSAQTLGEKFGKIYLISIFLVVGCIYFFTHNLSLILAVVLVVCADDVAVAIPIAYLRAIRTSATHGVIVKGGKHLELLGQIKTIVFDKTGTLTTGKLALARVVTVEGESESKVLELGLTAGSRSTHPFSKALQQYAEQKGVLAPLPDSVEEKGGMGIVATRGEMKIVTGRKIFLEEMNIEIPESLISISEREAEQGKSISYIAKDGKCIGFFSASDTPKPDAKKTLALLRTLGVKKFVMLTGDNALTAESIAREIGIDEWHAELKPEDKVEAIRRLQSNEHVAMVGDGVNDAAALSIASVGIAMGGLGSEGTIESAQIVLMRDDLKALPMAIQIAHSARRVSKQDFYIWGSTNLVGLLLVFGGLIGPAGAAAYNFLSDFLPLSNSLRVGLRK